MISDSDKDNIVNALANNESQESISKRFGCTQPNISIIKRANEYAINKLKVKLTEEHATLYTERAIKEEAKAGRIVESLDNDTLPNKRQESYLKRQDAKGKAILGIIANHSDTNINIQQNKITATIVPNVLKMFQSGAEALSDASNAMPIEAEVT